MYYAHQEALAVHSVGRVQLAFSILKPNLEKATPDDVKILMINATDLSVRGVIEAHSVRWQPGLYFEELKSTLGVGQYQFERFEAVEAWMNCAIATALFLEQLRATRLQDRRLSEERRHWWQRQRLHGLCEAFLQGCSGDVQKTTFSASKNFRRHQKSATLTNQRLTPRVPGRRIMNTETSATSQLTLRVGCDRTLQPD